MMAGFFVSVCFGHLKEAIYPKGLYCIPYEPS